MKLALERKLRKVRLLCQANLLLEHLAISLAAAGAAALLATFADRLFALSLCRLWMLPAVIGLACVAAAAVWAFRRPGMMEVAVLIDQRLALRERFSTALALAGSSDPFAVAARDESHRAAERADLAGKFAVRMSRRWLFPLSAWVAALAVILLLPVMDVLGHGRQRQKDMEQAAQLAQAKAEVRQVTEQLQVTMRELPNPELAAEAAKLGDAKDGLQAEDVKRQAISKLDELANRLEKSKASEKSESIRQIQDLLKGIKGTPAALSSKLNQAIAKADFKNAADILRDFQKEAERDKLSPEQRAELSRQLQDLSKQIQDLAAKDSSLKEELENAGVNKDLTKLSPDKLKEALEKQGLTQEQIDNLMKQAGACRSAASACNKLSEAMSACAGSNADPGALSDLADELGALDAMKQELAQTEGNLDRIKKAMAKLGQGACPGGLGEGQALEGGAGPWKEGLAEKPGRGSGGPGQGYGARPTADGGKKVDFNPTMVKGPNQEAPAVASYYFKGPQVKGEARRELTNTIQKASDAAAEAIEDNQIPRKMEGPIKNYFGQMEQTAKEPL